jgi:uncharacterized short protein YbdD (DUF466 family)
MPADHAPRRAVLRLLAAWRRGVVQRVLRRLIGAPDYQAYLDHCRRAGHPSRLTEREYVREFFENKGKAPRCC